jgi:alpha-ribazole phosphatase
MEIYLIRHTSPEIGEGICYGQSDIPLATTFEAECRTLRKFLPERFQAVYSSPISRCMRLAEKLTEKKEIISDSRLLELDFGDWELKSWDSIDIITLNNWMKDFVHVAASNGENFSMLSDRAVHFFKELCTVDCKQVAVVSHAGFIRAVITEVLEIPLRNAFKIPVSYGSVTKLKFDKSTGYCGIEYLSRVG